MGHVYNFFYLDLGVMIGIAFDSLLLGGTRIDYNQLRKSEHRNGLIGFAIRLVITVGWALLNLWGFVALLQMIVHKWLFLLGIPYFVFGFGLFTFLKFIFKLLGATRADIYPKPDVHAVQLRKAD